LKAAVQSDDGSPEVLEFKDIDKPVVEDDEVLVHVRAAAPSTLLTGPAFTACRIPHRRGLPGRGLGVAHCQHRRSGTAVRSRHL